MNSVVSLAIINNIGKKKTTELVLLFHKNITKLVFLWPNPGPKKLQSVNFLVDNNSSRILELNGQ